MSTAVIKSDPSTIEKIINYYRLYAIEKIPPGGVFVAKLSSCTITVYKSGKVMFQGNQAQVEAVKWGSSEVQETTSKPKKTTHFYTPPTTIRSMSIVGSDEVGTGDY